MISDAEKRRTTPYAKVGPLGLTYKKLSFKEKVKAFWVTKLMVDESDNVEWQLRMTFVELTIAIMFLVVLLIVAHGKYSNSDYILNNSLRRQLVDVKFLTLSEATISFLEINSAGDVWAFLEKGLMDLLFWEVYYHVNDNIAPTKKTDRHVLYENAIIGFPRIRMLAVRSDSCIIHKSFRRQFKSCYGRYSEENELKTDLLGADNKKWIYAPDLAEIEYSGLFATYGLGGYYELLDPNSLIKTKATIQALKVNKWITRATRVLFIDFFVFNTQVNLFGQMKIIIEFPTTGGTYSNAEIHSAKLFPYVSKMDYFVAAAEMIFAIFIFHYLLEELRELLHFGPHYFTLLSNYNDCLILGLGIFSSVYVLYRALKYYGFVVEIITTRKDSFANFETLFWWELLNIKIIAVMLFLTFMKLINFMDFTSYMGTLVRIIARARKDVTGFLVMLVLVFLAFAELGYLLFGTTVEVFKSFVEAIYALLQILLGEFDYIGLETSYRILGPVYYLCFVLFVFFILLNMFLAIMSEAYDQIRSGAITESPRLPMEKFLERGVWNIFQCIERPTKARVDRKNARTTITELRNALLRNNFTLTEIKMFFAKYGIDGTKEVSPEDVHKILKDFETKNLTPTQPPKLDELKLTKTQAMLDDDTLLRKKEAGGTGLSIKDYDLLLERLDHIEDQIDKMSDRLANVISLLDKTEKTYWLSKRTKRKLSL